MRACKYKNLVVENFVQGIGDADWSPVLSEPDPSIAGDNMVAIFNMKLDKHAPWRTMQSSYVGYT